MAEFLVFLGALAGSLVGSVAFELWLGRRGRIIKSNGPSVAQVERAERPRPFSKPNGKRSPKINDDLEAYNREIDA